MKNIFKHLKPINLILTALVLTQIYILLDYNYTSVRFTSRLFSLLFFSITINAVVFGSLFFFLKNKKSYKIPLIIALIFSNSLLFINSASREFSAQINDYISSIFISPIFRFKWIDVSLSDGNLIWSMAISIYIGIALLILNQVLVKKFVGYKNKLEKKIIIMGLGLYFLLLPASFMFTHYAIVGANYQFMQGMLSYNHNLIEVYDSKKQTNNFDIKELKWFENLQDAYNYYSAPEFKHRVATSKSKDEFYTLSLADINNLKQNGFVEKEKLNYNTMRRFHDWIQIYYNFSFRGNDNKYFWFTEISPVLNPYRPDDQDTLRHSVLLIKKSDNKGFYVLLDFNRTLRDMHLVYFFNVIFIAFNLLYLFLFGYVIKVHLKVGKTNV